jgi:hypothetical protein
MMQLLHRFSKGIITPRDGKLLADRSDVEAFNDSMAFSI